MECKIFYARSRLELQKTVNSWLQEHPVSPDSMSFQFSTVSLEDSTEFILEHTLIIFFVPMIRI
jgi:hypothetical protein